MRNALIVKPTRVALALGGLIALASIAFADSTQNFTFRDAEFAIGDEGVRAARSFVASQLTPGLEMNTATARVEHAGASCKAPSSAQATVNCEYFTLARPAGGDLGENVWTVKLMPGPDGKLQRAIVERSRVGMPGYSHMLID
jgi:hypothetical protein